RGQPLEPAGAAQRPARAIADVERHAGGEPRPPGLAEHAGGEAEIAPEGRPEDRRGLDVDPVVERQQHADRAGAAATLAVDQGARDRAEATAPRRGAAVDARLG